MGTESEQFFLTILIDFKVKLIRRDKEGYFILTKGTII